MKKINFCLLILGCYFIPVAAGDDNENLIDTMEKKRAKVYQGEETKEEKEYYKKVTPKKSSKNSNFYEHSHPLQEKPIPHNSLD